jgi:hypothetical protein
VSSSWCFSVVLAGRVVAGLRLARTASERRGSADRHADVRGSGPHVGCAQAVAPDLMRHAVVGVAVRSRGSCLVSAVLRRVLGLAGAVAPIGDRPTVHSIGSGVQLGPQEPGKLAGDGDHRHAGDVLAAFQLPEPAAQASLGRPGAGQGVG